MIFSVARVNLEDIIKFESFYVFYNKGMETKLDTVTVGDICVEFYLIIRLTSNDEIQI